MILIFLYLYSDKKITYRKTPEVFNFDNPV